MKLKLIVLISFFWLSACISVPEKRQVMLAEGVSYLVSPPPEQLVGVIQTHLIEVSFNKESHSLIAQVEYANNEITIAAMSVSGVPLFDLIWHENKPSELTQYVPLPGIDLNYIIADLQWVNWPIKALKNALISDGALVEQKNAIGFDWQRNLIFQNQLVMQIDKKDKQYFLHHKLRDYQITITDLSED